MQEKHRTSLAVAGVEGRSVPWRQECVRAASGSGAGEGNRLPQSPQKGLGSDHSEPHCRFVDSGPVR